MENLRIVLLIASSIVAALCRPDVGYSYQQPAVAFKQNLPPDTSYGTPFLKSSSLTSPSNIYQKQQSSRNYLAPSAISKYQSQSLQTPDATYLPQSGPITVQKHIYVHVAPPEPEEPVPQRQVVPAPRQKHYKIIFIKAPYQAPRAPYVAPPPPPPEEKTLVYVLVRKPEVLEEVNMGEQVVSPPISKPEVYFIRYKSKEDREQQKVENIQDNDSVVVESADIRNRGKSLDEFQGYRYSKPQ